MTAMNPVLRRELLERWRGRRAFLVITIYTAVLAGIVQLLWLVGRAFLREQVRFGFVDAATGPAMGRYLFENLLGFVLLLVLFIAPGYAAAQIAGERERKTLSLLQVTLVRPWEIVVGKLGASTAWLLLLVIAALPFGAAAFFLGGVTVGDLLRSTFVIVALAVAVAAMSLGVSSITRKTTASIVVTYGLVMLLTLGTLFAAGVEAAMRRFDFDRDTRPIALYLNPFYGLADAARADSFRFSGFELPSVLTPFGAILPDPDFFGNDVAIARPAIEPAFGPDGAVVDDFFEVDPFEDRRRRQPVWLITLSLYTLFGVGGFVIATQRVKPEVQPLIGRRKAAREREARRVAAGVPPVGAPPPGGVMIAPLPEDLPPPPPPPSGPDGT